MRWKILPATISDIELLNTQSATQKCRTAPQWYQVSVSDLPLDTIHKYYILTNVLTKYLDNTIFFSTLQITHYIYKVIHSYSFYSKVEQISKLSVSHWHKHEVSISFPPFLFYMQWSPAIVTYLWPWSFKPVTEITGWYYRFFFSVICFLSFRIYYQLHLQDYRREKN